MTKKTRYYPHHHQTGLSTLVRCAICGTPAVAAIMVELGRPLKITEKKLRKINKRLGFSE